MGPSSHEALYLAALIIQGSPLNNSRPEPNSSRVRGRTNHVQRAAINNRSGL